MINECGDEHFERVAARPAYVAIPLLFNCIREIAGGNSYRGYAQH